MIKAGISALFVVISLLIATPQINAQDLDSLNLVGLSSEKNICTSSLKPYILTLSKNCPIAEQRQAQFSGNVKSNQVEEFSIAHSISAATYTPPTIIVSEANIPEPSPTIIVSEQNVTHVGNNPDIIFDLINSHRASIGKKAFVKNDAICSLAKTRSNELASELSRGVLHSGLYNRNLPYLITENAKSGGDENETVRWWLNSSIHRRAIESNNTYSCGGCTGSNCSQLFTSYEPKVYNITQVN